jgi:hypothetical protein
MRKYNSMVEEIQFHGRGNTIPLKRKLDFLVEEEIQMLFSRSRDAVPVSMGVSYEDVPGICTCDE